MKKQLLKLGAICIALTIGGNAMAQDQSTATILNLGANAITVDGVGDGVWTNVDPIAIERIFGTETPAITVSWKALWSDDGIYVLVEAEDDEWNPYWITGAAGWASDHVELYFDVSDPQQDAGGPAAEAQKLAGNWQIAPDFLKTSGKDTTESNGVVQASVFDEDGNYTKEYFVPYSAFQRDGADINPAVDNVIGFDVSVSDNDGTARQRIVWSNDGVIGDAPNESWNNCDMVGIITLSDEEVPGGAIKQNVSKTTILVSTVISNGKLKFNTNVSDVKVLNSIGQVVKTSTNVSDLNKGVYIVTAKTAKGQTVANRFVIQ